MIEEFRQLPRCSKTNFEAVWVYKRAVRVQDTDATGVLYFANQLQIGLEAFEDFLWFQGFSIGKMIENKQIFLPVVHVEADFFAPIQVSDQLELILTFPKVGVTSFTHASRVLKQGKEVGFVEMTHVSCCPTKKEATPLPESLKGLFL